jgi:UDP-3-O-[3-hydroxymyristoyl] glucosamine N-acyltransferase
MRLKEIAEKLSCILEGNGDVEIKGVATLEEAGEGDLSFLTNSKYFSLAKKTRASALIVSPESSPLETNLLKNKNPYLTFAKAIELFFPRQSLNRGVHPTAFVSDTAKIGSGVSIGAFSFIGDRAIIEENVVIQENCTIHEEAVVGAGTLIYSGSRIRERVRIGRGCIIQNNAVIGSDGFGFAKDNDGRWFKIAQVGTVIIEDEVEIGAGTTIDRATLGATRVGRGTKIDNLVQIGHGCTLGEDSLICAQVGLAGSTRIGRRVVLAGQVGSAGHLAIEDDAIVTAQSGVGENIRAGTVVSGTPAFDNRVWLKSQAIFTRLPGIQKSIRTIEARLRELEITLKEKL